MQFDDERLRGILRARRILGRSQFPGEPDIKIAVRVLTDVEIDNARFASQSYLDQFCKKFDLDRIEYVRIDPEWLDRENQRQFILRAFFDADSPEEHPTPFFSNIEQVRQLDSVLINQLWEIYIDWQDTVNPHIRMTEKEVDELVEALKKEQAAKLILATYEPRTLWSLVRTLGARLRS